MGVLQLQGKFMWVIVIMAVVIVVIVVLFLSFLAYHCHEIKKRLVSRPSNSWMWGYNENISEFF